jgi:putative hydrolase of the HAD superfamily
MKSIRSIILDFGGVISQPQKKYHVDNMLKIINQDPSNFMEVYRRFRGDYDKGILSGEEYWLKISNHFGCELNKIEIKELINEDIKSWININDKMFSLIMEIRKRVYNLSIISNMPADLLDYMIKHLDWLSIFDECTFSCEIGINKPDTEIYFYCIDKIGVSPNDCLFVDDSLDNVDGAKKIGMNTIHFISFEHFSEELKRNYLLSKI